MPSATVTDQGTSRETTDAARRVRARFMNREPASEGFSGWHALSGRRSRQGGRERTTALKTTRARPGNDGDRLVQVGAGWYSRTPDDDNQPTVRRRRASLDVPSF